MFQSFSSGDSVILMLERESFSEDETLSLRVPAREFLAPVSKPALANQAVTVSNPALGRILDVLVACAALVFVAPLMLFLALAVKLSSRGPVFFRQDRLGHSGKIFACLKFRTMRSDADATLERVLAANPALRAEWQRDHKLRSDPRISFVGRILRKTSLDELPQLINVLLGDMSIVGPRPIVPAEAARYHRHINSYLAVRPGITGLWQVSGRNDTTYRRRVACDVAYVRNKSAVNDLRIMAMTVPVVLLARGAY